MKICVISPGVVHAIPRTVAIADQFDEVHFIDITGKADRSLLESHGIIYHGLEDAGKSAVIKSRQLPDLFKKIEPDVIVCHFAAGDHFFNAIAYGRCPVSAITMGHDVLYDEGDRFESFFTRFLIRLALRQLHFLSAKSRYVARRIESYGVHCPVEVNYWGADLTKYCPGKQIEARRELGWDENATVILSPRALEPRLNIHLIVEAFHEVLTKRPNSMLVILGRSSPDYKDKIDKTIERLNLVDKVRVLSEVSQDVLPLYIRASDVVVSIGHSEGFPNTVLEVMACKVPIVVGKIAQVEELLENAKSAWICEIEPKAVATAILDVLDDQGRSERITNAAYTIVKEYADIRVNGITFSKNLKRVSAANIRWYRIELITFRILYVIYRIQRKILIMFQR